MSQAETRENNINPGEPKRPQLLKLKRIYRNVIKVKNTNFVCVMCRQSFKSHIQLKEHFKNHAKNTIDIRGRPIEKSTLLKNPKQDTVTLNLIECDFCPEVLPNISKAIEHKFRKHRSEGSNHFCEYCGKLFPIRVALEQHKQTTNCAETSVKTESIKNSEKQEVTQPYKCNFCTVAFVTKNALDFHEKCVHKFEKSLLLPIFIPPPSRKIKMSNSSEVFSVYYCHICGSEYILKYNLKKHLQTVHSTEERNCVPEEGIIKCKTCEAIFYTKKAYEAHSIHHKPGDLYVTSEEQRQKVVARVDLDFDFRRVPAVRMMNPRKRKPPTCVQKPSTSSIKKEKNGDSDDEPLSPPSSPSDSSDEDNFPKCQKPNAETSAQVKEIV